MESYIEKTKHYQKQHQKQYQQHEYHQESLPFKHDRVLVADEIDNLFWNKLLSLGWKMNTEFIIDKSTAKSIQFMFTCPDCGKALHSQQSHTITYAKSKVMTDRRWLNQVIAKHKATTKGCQPAEYDENGEAIPEA